MGETETSNRLCHANKASQKSGDESSSSSSSSDSSDLPMPTPPDGGWGWVVVLSAFVINLIADGVSFSFGVLFVELHDHFSVSHSKLAWIGSVFFAIPLLAGPISGAMINKFGCRRTCIAGGILSSIGCILSVFATSTEYLCVTFGVISGLGLSLVYTPSVVLVAFYFEKKRAFATGLSVSGTGIGTFAVAPLMDYLIKTYGWRGTILIIGGLFLNTVVCGALLRPLETSSQRKRRKFLQSIDRLSRPSRNNSLLNFSGNEDTINHIEMQFDGRRTSAAVLKIKQSLCEPVTHSLVQLPTYFYQDGNITPKGSSSKAHVAKVKFGNTQLDNTCGKGVEDQKASLITNIERGLANGHVSSCINTLENSDLCNNVANDTCMQKHSTSNNLDEQRRDIIPVLHSDIATLPHFECIEPLHQSQSLKDLQISFSETSLQRNRDIPSTSTTLPQAQKWEKPNITLQSERSQPAQRANKSSHLDRFLPMNRRDIFYRGSLIRLDEFIQNKASSCPQLYRASDAGSDDEAEERIFSCCQLKTAKRVIKEMLDVSIFKSVKYIVFFLSNFILYAWYDVPYFYLPDYALHVGLNDEQASMIIAVIGIANMVGQIFFGVIADSPKVSASLVYGVSMVICGVNNFFYPLCTTFLTICINSVIFGFCIGANYSLCSIIIVEVLSLDKLTNAYGIMMCGQGLANLVGPPFAGFFYDLTGSYLTTFICSGGFIVLSGFLMFIVALIQFKSRRRIERRQEDGTSSGAAEMSLMETHPDFEQAVSTPQPDI